MQGLLQHLAGRRVRRVAGEPDAALVELEQLDMLAGLIGAEDQPQRRPPARPRVVLLQPPVVHFHLPLVGGLEPAQFQLDRHEPPQSAVIKGA
jgi:hypothetical protein